MCPHTTLECALLGILDYATRVTFLLAGLHYQVVFSSTQGVLCANCMIGTDTIHQLLLILAYCQL